MSAFRSSRVFFQPEVNGAKSSYQSLSNQARSETLQLMVLAIGLSFIIGTSLANAQEPRDRLLPVVTHCIADTGVGTTGATAGLCKWPRQDQCSAKESCCSRTTQVWDENADFVAILSYKHRLFILYGRNPDAEKTLARSLEEFEGAPTPPE